MFGVLHSTSSGICEVQREAEAALHQQQQHAERMQKLKQELAAHRAAVLQHEAAAAAEAASRQQDLAIRVSNSHLSGKCRLGGDTL